MARFLYAVGLFSFHRRRVVAGTWVVLLVLLGVGALTLRSPTSSAFTIPGTESQRALDSLATEFPGGDGASGSIVLKAPAGQTVTTATIRAAVEATVTEARALPGVVNVVDPFTAGSVSRDGSTALVSVQYGEPADALTATQIDAFGAVGDSARSAGVEVAAGGGVQSAPAATTGPAEGIALLIAAGVLVLTFGSLLAAGMTLLTALTGVLAGIAGLFTLTRVVSITSVAPTLALMLGVAVGIDYALFIGSRHRGQLVEGTPLGESVALATAKAGSAVVFAGATVVIALAGLSVVGVPFLSQMGLAAAGTVAVAVLVAVTLFPALLGFAGSRILSKKVRARMAASGGMAVAATSPPGRHLRRQPAPATAAPHGAGFRWARLVTRFRVPVVVVGVLGLAALALPVRDLQLALPSNATAEVGSPARTAYDLVSAAFGPGANGPLVLVVGAGTPAATTALAGQVTGALTGTTDVVAVAPGAVSRAGTTRLLTVVPASDPTSRDTAHLVERIRDDVRPLAAAAAGGSVAVSGVTAVGVDVSDKLARALPLYLLLIVGLSFLLLVLAFRSILVPLKATLGFLLTVGSTFGVTVVIFQWGRGASVFGVDSAAPIVSFLPILIVGILFGLAMDYEVFIVSRIREQFTHHGDAQAAMVDGVGQGARVVTAAAVIMVSVFGGFIFGDDPIIKTIGFGLAFGVFVDAFVVRLTLVPAVLSLLGSRAWWFPRWLARITPEVDIEGANLRPAAARPTKDAPTGDVPTDAPAPAGPTDDVPSAEVGTPLGASR